MIRPRRARIHLAASLSLLLCAEFGLMVSADEPKLDSVQLENDVKRLVNDLQSDKRSIRSEAEAALKRQGPEILPYLPSPEILSNAAARESVRRVRILLEKEQAEALSRASTVSLRGKFTLAAIVSAIINQTGNAILLDDLDEAARDQLVTVDYEVTPFWVAWDQLLHQLKLSAAFDQRFSALRLSTPDESSDDEPIEARSVTYSGPFRLEIVSVRRSDQIGETKPQRLRLIVNLIAEPRLRPLFLKYASADIIFATADGEAISAATPTAKWDLPWGTGETGIELRWDFLVPKSLSATELMGRGKVHVELASGTEKFIFDDLTAEARIAQRRGGVIVGLENVQTETMKDRSRTNIRISVDYDVGGPAFESHRNWMFHNQAVLLRTGPVLEDKLPPSFRPDDFITERQGDGTFVITYRFDNLPADAHDYQFEYQAPTLLVTVPVQFLFPRINIPGPESEK